MAGTSAGAHKGWLKRRGGGGRSTSRAGRVRGRSVARPKARRPFGNPKRRNKFSSVTARKHAMASRFKSKKVMLNQWLNKAKSGIAMEKHNRFVFVTSARRSGLH